MQRYLFSAYHFPVFLQTATFDIQRLKCNVNCFPHIIFPYFFKPQRLKCNVACFSSIIFPYFFKNKSSYTKKPTTFENTTLLPISLNCLHYRCKTFFNFINNAAYIFHYICNNDNSWTISFI